MNDSPLRLPSGGQRYPVIQKHASRTKQAPSPAEIFRQQCFADMLEHADADQFVELLFRFDFPVIANLHLAARSQPRLANALACEFGLGNAQRDAEGIDAILACGVDQQALPSRSPVPVIARPVSVAACGRDNPASAAARYQGRRPAI